MVAKIDTIVAAALRQSHSIPCKYQRDIAQRRRRRRGLYGCWIAPTETLNLANREEH